MQKEQRWKQRFEHYQLALKELKEALKKEKYSTLERAGLIQLYELSFELAWKSLKDFLYYEGIEANSPRSSIKQAFALGLIDDGQAWLEGLESRNLFTHTYSASLAKQAEKFIRMYVPLLVALEKVLEQKL